MAYKELEATLQSFLTSALNGVYGHLREPISFIPARRAPGIHWIKRQGGPQQGYGRFRKKIPYVCWESNQDSLVVQPIYYTDCGIPAVFMNVCFHIAEGKRFFGGVGVGGKYFAASCIPSASVSVFVELNASLMYPEADWNARKFQNGITYGEQKKIIRLLKILNRCLPRGVTLVLCVYHWPPLDSSEKAKSLEIHTKKKLLGSPVYFLETYREKVSFHYTLSVPDF